MTCLNHTCNVLVAVSAPRLEEKAEEANCTGDFYISAKTFPGVISLSIGVLAEDPEWSDSVKWVCQALIAAERHGITKEHIDLHHGRQQDEKQGEQLTQVTTFGEDYKDMSCCAIDAVGNTGDMWALVNPAVLNFPVADNSSGVLCSSSLGPVEEAGPDPSPDGILSDTSKRGHLRCGVRLYQNYGFARHLAKNNETAASYQGTDVDCCRAVAAALFSGGHVVEFVELKSDKEGFLLLHNSSMDIFDCVAMNFERDVREPTTGVGFAFSKPCFYNNTSFFSTSPR